MKEEQKHVSALKLTLTASQDKRQNHQEEPIPPQEENFLSLRNEYLALKVARKKQVELQKRTEFGVSSSEQDDVGASESDSQPEKRTSTLEEQTRFRESQKIKLNRKASKENQISIYFSPKKGKQTWTPANLTFDDQTLFISQKPFHLKQIHKIKVIQGLAVADCHKLKLSFIDQNQIFIAANTKPFRQLPLIFFIFSYVIQQKLINMGKKLFQCPNPSLPGIPEFLIKNSYTYGKIFKKSSILGRWQERLVVINKEGIYGYKKFNEKHCIFIAANTIKQLWTRFQVEDGLLVLKLLHNSSKTQFGLPLTQLLDKRSWLYNFYRLAFP